MEGTLYIVATPIGNLEDISQRALTSLKEADYILAEDTRQAGKILKRYEINTRLISYHHHSLETKKLEILKHLLEGKKLALVTDAGTPGIADPGNELISFLIDQEPKIKIIPIPGPSALTAALSVSGFNTSKFAFLGFLPKKAKTKLLNEVKSWGVALVFFESPYRLKKSLIELGRVLGEDKDIFVAGELTKLHEKHYRGRVAEVLAMLETEEKALGRIKGEFVVVVSK